MTEHAEYHTIRARINELMTGGIIGDGIGPTNTARTIKAEYGVSYTPLEVWRIWRQGKTWANPKDDIYGD